jgi:hypothetical protein
MPSTATSRVLVQKPIAEKFTEALKTAFAATEAALGSDPLDPATSFGPIVDKLQYDKIMSYIEIGKKTATLVTGGEQKGDKGFFIKPTIFLNPDPESPIVREEIFGPVMCIQTFETEEEAVALANGTEYGLACGFPLNSINSPFSAPAHLRGHGKLIMYTQHQSTPQTSTAPCASQASSSAAASRSTRRSCRMSTRRLEGSRRVGRDGSWASMRCWSIRSRRVCISSEFTFSFVVFFHGWGGCNCEDEELMSGSRLDMGSKL